MGFRGQFAHGNPEPLMSALGQKQTFPSVYSMSALPPKADIAEGDWYVRFVPKADISAATRLVRSNIGPNRRRWMKLHAGTRDEAANSCGAVAFLIGPHYGRAETVGFGYNGVVRHHKPFSLNADTIMALLCVPVDVLHTDTVGKSAAQPVSAPKVLEPSLQRRIGEAAVVTRV